jgi:RimJ/RimL family protein N-acetyltransferase
MNISFISLNESHFPTIFKWLETTHVKQWWQYDAEWVRKLKEEKINGYQADDGIKKPMDVYIICVDEHPVGYIQIYNAYDFPRSKPLIGLPLALAAFDIFIGDETYLNKGIAHHAINQLFDQYKEYTHLFADTDINNHIAIKAYEKCGFKKISIQHDTNEVWMIKQKS